MGGFVVVLGFGARASYGKYFSWPNCPNGAGPPRLLVRERAHVSSSRFRASSRFLASSRRDQSTIDLSYFAFLEGSLSVSYASWMSWKVFVAAWFVRSRSGWALRAVAMLAGGGFGRGGMGRKTYRI